MRTYYDPEDDYCDKAANYERLTDRADYLRTERKDREMEEAQEKEMEDQFDVESCPACDDLRTVIVKITQMNCTEKTDIAGMIREIRQIARDAVPDYKERARVLRHNREKDCGIELTEHFPGVE